MNPPLILITNDDGWQASGLRVLVEAVSKMGQVVVVAPDGPRSGQALAITVNAPVKYQRLPINDYGAQWYSCTGTPSDCVKMAMYRILGQRPDLVLSGINHGSNSSISAHYSGTIGAVLEGCINDIPAIGFSLCDHDAAADFQYLRPFIAYVTRKVLEQGLPSEVCLNVNAPTGPLKGLRVCRLCNGRWRERFDSYQDPYGRPFYWLTGDFINNEPQSDDTDEYWMQQGYAVVVPLQLDLTHHATVKQLQTWNTDEPL